MMKKVRISTIILQLLFILSANVLASNIVDETQTIRGQIIDQDSKSPL